MEYGRTRLIASSTISTTAAVSTSSTAATASTVFARLGLVNRQGPTILHRFIEAIDRRLSFGVGTHFDETESFAAAGIAVDDHLNVTNFAISREQLFEVGGGNVVREISAIKLLTQRSNPKLKTPGNGEMPCPKEKEGSAKTNQLGGTGERASGDNPEKKGCKRSHDRLTNRYHLTLPHAFTIGQLGKASVTLAISHRTVKIVSGGVIPIGCVAIHPRIAA